MYGVLVVLVVEGIVVGSRFGLCVGVHSGRFVLVGGDLDLCTMEGFCVYFIVHGGCLRVVCYF